MKNFSRSTRAARIYAEAQCAELNRIERTPSLNYQATGSRLQDGVLWDEMKQDIHECLVCSHRCTMIVENALTVSAYNQGARDTATAKGGDGGFAAKSPRVGCYCFSLSCGGRPDGGNCPECTQRVKDGERPSPTEPGECGFSCRVCSCRCQVAFDEVHRYQIANAISTTAKKKRAARGEEKKPEEKGLAVVSRALATMLESSLVRESQTVNGRSDSELIEDAKTNCALDLLGNPAFEIDLSLRRRLSMEVPFTWDVRLRSSQDEAGGGDTAEAATIVSLPQAKKILKERAKTFARGNAKNGDMTPDDLAFSKNAGNHHRFSRNHLSESPVDVGQVSRDASAAVGGEYAAAAADNSSDAAIAAAAEKAAIAAAVMRTRKCATRTFVDLNKSPRTRRFCSTVRNALVKGKPKYVTIIEDMFSPEILSQELLAYCMEQADQDEKQNK